jgi:microcystin degradation protein MlrC
VRIAIASFVDETMTFLDEPTPTERFEPATRRGQAVIDENRDIPTYINGYIKVLEAEGAEMVPILETRKAPGPFSSWITTECFDKYATEIVEGLKAAGNLDGVLLSLHGAMAVTAVSKPEAELCRRVRAAVGPGVPIMATFDMHSNEDEELIDATDAVFVIKTYPHVDSDEIGEIAARCMVETVRENFRPTQALRRPGIVSPSIFQGTDDFPMKAVYDRCREWEKEPGVYCVSAGTGFAYCDVPDIGMYVVAVTNNDLALAEKVAQDVSDYCWSIRDAFARKLPKPKEAVAQVMEIVARGEGPVAVADGADRIGDSTWVLKELIEQEARNWAIPGISDPKVAAELEAHAKVGDRVKVKIGGWYGPHSGEPVEIDGVIEFMGRPEYRLVGPMGRGRLVRDGFVASVNLGTNEHVVISDRTRSAIDSAPFTAVGIDVSKLDIIVLKSRCHHRAYWDQVARVNFPIDAPGYREVVDLTELTYENIPDDVYPIGSKWRT